MKFFPKPRKHPNRNLFEVMNNASDLKRTSDNKFFYDLEKKTTKKTNKLPHNSTVKLI